jgi:hypothetical protein
VVVIPAKAGISACSCEERVPSINSGFRIKCGMTIEKFSCNVAIENTRLKRFALDDKMFHLNFDVLS